MPCTIFAETRPGARPYNQDRIGHWTCGDARLLALADGLGGHGNGEVAAQVALASLQSAFRGAARPRVAQPDRFLRESIDAAHADIVRHAAQKRYAHPPCTTVVACLVQDGEAWWSFVGDSRLYLIRDGRIAMRTRDHTRVQQLIDAGRMREEAAMVHPERHKLLQCLGAPTPPVAAAVAGVHLERDDLVLLCSDGLWAPLTARQLLIGLIGKDAKAALPALMNLAESRAGADCDNVSILAMRWDSDAVAEPVRRSANLGDTIRQRLEFGKS